LLREHRFVAWALGIGVLSFMGMPPLAGFFGKFFLFKYLAVSGNMTLAAIAGLCQRNFGLCIYSHSEANLLW
jgi:NADH:ubiquinone oxidoreductase subunit 2 (subunit N)